MTRVLKHLQRLKNGRLDAHSSRFTRWTKPLGTSLPLATVADLGRSKSELIAENALLRQQLIILKCQLKRPACTKTDRVLLVLLASKAGSNLAAGPGDRATRYPAQMASGALSLVLETQVQGSCLQAQVASETIALIKQMATENRLWGAERIRGEILKLGIRVCKRTIQKYMRRVRIQQPRGQKWSTFLRNHAGQIWACDAPASH